MKNIRGMVISLLLTGALAPVASREVCAQWRKVAPHMLQDIYLLGSADYGGAITYKDGLLIAGKRDLWISEDSGITWRSSIPLGSNRVVDIDIFDRNHILVTYDIGIVDRSSDGGRTWSPLIATSGSSFGYEAIFLDAPDHLVYASPENGVQVSTNDGQTWTTHFSSSLWFAKLLYTNGHIYGTMTDEFAGPGKVQLIRSTDNGTTWSVKTGTADWDSYTMTDDKCSPATFYLVNEDAVNTDDNSSNVFRTTDEGNTWRSVASGSTDMNLMSPYFPGGVSAVPGAVFVQTRNAGIIRSTDQGTTWDNIGGPHIGYDSRFVVAVTPNLLFAVDSEGSVWRTDNSGGSPMGTSILSTHSLFSDDSLSVCANDLVRSIDVMGLCAMATVTRLRIEGDGASSYSATQSGNRIDVTLSSAIAGERHATLIVELSSGASESVSLDGFVRSPESLALKMTDQATATIGGTIEIPVRVAALSQAADVTLVLHYDPRLSYLGSFDNTNISVDLPNESWPGRSKLVLRNVVGPGTVAVSRFTVWAGADQPFAVTVDSGSINIPSLGCSYVSGDSAAASVQGSVICGASFLAKFIQNESLELTVSPNPAHTFLDARLRPGGESVTMIDELGRVIATCDASTGTAHFDLRSVPEGTYTCLARSTYGTASRSVVIVHP